MELRHELLLQMSWYEYIISRAEKLERYFPGESHTIKFHIFQSICKQTIHLLITFQYNITCESCEKIQDKDKK